mmetsp:Transcript_18420/g.45870  ORF Transcript_18420/g.45870 Transcript_18420/m.45870 type:complete len:564 (-) Transcript_18420:514-2205(-)
MESGPSQYYLRDSEGAQIRYPEDYKYGGDARHRATPAPLRQEHSREDRVAHDGAVSHQQQHWQQQQRQRQQQPTAAQDQQHHQPMTGYDRRDQPMTAHDRRDRSDWQQYHEGEGPGRSGGDGDSGRPRPQTAGRADHDRANGYPTDNRRVPDGYPNPGVIKYRRAAAPSQHDAGPSHYPGVDRGRGGGDRGGRPRSAGPAPTSERSHGGLGSSSRSMASSAGSETQSLFSLRRQDKRLHRALRIREGTFVLEASESYRRPEYNALLDPMMGEYFDRGGRRRFLVKTKLVNQYGELNDVQKWKELHYQEIRKEKEAEKVFDAEIQEELSERRKAVAVRKNQLVEERRLIHIEDIREDHRERIGRIRQVSMKRLEKYTGPGNFWLAFKTANAFTSLLKKQRKGKKPWDDPAWEERAVVMIQRMWRGKVARRLEEAEAAKKAEKLRQKSARTARAQAAAGPGYSTPLLVSSGSFDTSEAFEQGSARRGLKLDKLAGLAEETVRQGGRALEDLSPLLSYSVEDRKRIVKIQAAARARKARVEVNAIRLRQKGDEPSGGVESLSFKPY